MKKKRKKNQRESVIVVTAAVIIVVILSLLQFNSVLTETEKNRVYNTMRHWAVQAATSLEYKTEKYFGMLECAGIYLSQIELHSEDTKGYLEDLSSVQNVEFSCMGVADMNGKAVCMDGYTEDVSDKKFFKRGMSGKKGCICYKENGVSYVAFYAPVHETDLKTVKGIVYGELEGEKLDVFQVKPNEVRLRELFVADSNGDYILAKGKEETFGENIFKDLEKMDPSLSVDGIRSLTDSGMIAHTEVKNRGVAQHVIVMPTTSSAMYIISVMDEQNISDNVYAYQKEVVFLGIKILLAAAAVAGIYLFHQKQERRYVRKLNAQLMLNEETYKITSKRCDLCVFTYDGGSEQIHFLNDKYKDFGMDQEMLNVPLLFNKIAETNPEAVEKLRGLKQSIKENRIYDSCKISVRYGDQIRYWEIYITNIYDADGKFARSVGSVEDITDNEIDRMKLQKERGFRNTLLADCLGHMVVDVDNDVVLDASYSVLKNADQEHYCYSQVLNSFLSKKISPEYWEELSTQMGCESMRRLYESGERKKTIEYMSRNVFDDEVWMACQIHVEMDYSSGHVIAYLIYRNIDKIKRSREQLERQAQVDILTGIFNRTTGVERIEEVLGNEASETTGHAFVIVDLDNFKELNDTLGHMWGDKALYDVACIMKKHCRSEDVVCRFGGDEFVVFLCNIPEGAVERNIAALTRKLHLKYAKDGKEVVITASIGVALVPRDGTTFREIYEVADRSLYKVKNAEKSGYCFSGGEVHQISSEIKKATR